MTKFKEKILLIAGCSNTAGSEIDGTPDSAYNRSVSFGNLLTNDSRIFSDYTAVNIALCGAPNDFITSSVLLWFGENYNPDTMDVFVLVGWTDSARMAAPFTRPTHYDQMNPCVDWYSEEMSNYLTVNTGWIPPHEDEKKVTTQYVNFMANNTDYLELLNINRVLQLQYFFKSKNVPYLMVNTLFMFSEANTFLTPYKNMIDSSRYFAFLDNNESFYPKYQNLGYNNEKAQWFHHDEEPHRLYSLVIENHITRYKLWQ